MRDISLIGSAAGLAGWDQETMMPRDAAAIRAEQLSSLSGILHEKFVDRSLGRDLKRLHAKSKSLSPDERVCVREWLRDYEHATKLSEDLVREMARLRSLSQAAWIEAKKKSDFKAFAPWLRKTIDLKRREADAIGYKGARYDALLDAYEPSMTTALLDPIMAEMRDGLIPIIESIKMARKKPDGKVLTKRYPESAQDGLCHDVMAAMGLDPRTSRLDRSAHPFCIGLAPTDVRITTRYSETWLPQALYGVMHESGHALYEQGLDVRHFGTPLSEAASVGVHESQSRMWENMIGRSRPFMHFLLPLLRKHFPGQLRGATPESFYRAINRVTPSAVRVEADEVTYNLHIVLRYELEKGLIAGDIRITELPALWNERMRYYLGVKPKNDAEGVLQDTHWATGIIGYFPTYLLGNIYAAQLWQRMRRDIPSIDAKISKGQFPSILAWLRKHVHRHGRKYAPTALIRRASGKTPSARHFLDYLRGKYGEIYNIEL
jgi:carboxypeptidase Taq